MGRGNERSPDRIPPKQAAGRQRAMTTPRWTYRLAAVLIGVVVALGATELALRAASAVVLWRARGTVEPLRDHEVRILCIGESTTGGVWPEQLEELLRHRHPERSIRVFKRYFVGGRTDRIEKALPAWLTETRPHIAITMLGINDEGNVLVYQRSETVPWLVRHSLTAKLTVLLWRSFRAAPAPETSSPPGEAAENVPGDPRDDATRELIDRLEREREEAEKRFQFAPTLKIQPQLIEIDPRTPYFHVVRLAETLTDDISSDRLNSFLRNEVDIDPRDFDLERDAAQLQAWGDAHGDAFGTLRLLTSFASRAGNQKLLDTVLSEAGSDPRPLVAGSAWVRQAARLFRNGRQPGAAAALQRARTLLPGTPPWKLVLGFVAFSLHAYDQAVDLLQQTVRESPEMPPRHRDVVIGWLSQSCAMAGDSVNARRWDSRLLEDQSGRFLEFTRVHYTRIVDHLRGERIQVIAMQYPTLPLASLRNLLGNRSDVRYLENRAAFELELQSRGYEALFTDRFAGSFGHMTDLGNSLVAARAASAIDEILTGQPAPTDGDTRAARNKPDA